MTRRWLELALFAFPKPERERYGQELLEAWQDAAAARPGLGTWLVAFWDVLRNGLLLRWEVARSRPGERRRPSLPDPVLRSARRTPVTETLARNLRLGLRRLSREPGFTVTAVLLLALGIGATTTIFSVVNAVLFKPLPYERPEDLVRIYMTEPQNRLPDAVSYPEYQELQRLDGLFSATAFHADPTILNLGRDGQVRTVIAEAYSSSLFPLLGLQPALGRAFTPEEEDAAGSVPPVVVLSHRLWQNRFAADPGVLGSQLSINGHLVTIVGVGPEGFTGTVMGFEPEVYLSWGTAALVDRHSRAEVHDRGLRNLYMVARKNEEVTLDQVRSALSAVASNLEADHPETNEDLDLVVFAAGDVRSHPMLDRAFVPLSAFLLVVVGLVLTVAVSNLANLLLAKASARRREMALRTALGARRRELVGQLLAESVLLAIVGGALGSLLAYSAPFWLSRLREPLPVPVTLELGLDWRVFLFALGLSLLTGVLLGLAPALKASRSATASAIRGEAPKRLGRRRRFRSRDALIVLQVAVSTVLLAGGGLFLKAMLAAQHTDPGFDTREVVAANLDATLAGYRDEDSGRRFWERTLERMEHIPEARSVALTSRVPFGILGKAQAGVSTLEERRGGGGPGRAAELSVVTPGYWETLGIPLLSGRSFEGRDDASAPQVAVISETLASSVWGEASAVGRSLEVEGRGLVEVVGVVADVKLRRLSEEPRPHVYLPFGQHYEPWMAVTVRTADTASMKETLRRELEIVDPKAAFFENKTLEEYLGLVLLPARAASSLLLATGIVALLLASCGLYGIIAFAIVQRTREVGIRAALGATRGRLVGMVVGEALKLVGAGLAIGLVLASLASRPLRSLLYGLSPADPATFATVALVLAAVTTIAALLPARRAARVDVVAALKGD